MSKHLLDAILMAAGVLFSLVGVWCFLMLGYVLGVG